MIGPVQELEPDTETEDGEPAFTAQTIAYGLLEKVRVELTGEFENSDRSFGAKIFRRECAYKLQEYLSEMPEEEVQSE